MSIAVTSGSGSATGALRAIAAVLVLVLLAKIAAFGLLHEPRDARIHTSPFSRGVIVDAPFVPVNNGSCDAYYGDTTLILNLNSSYADASPAGVSITVNGSPTGFVTGPFGGTNGVNLGATAYLSATASTLTFPGDGSIEMWAYPTSAMPSGGAVLIQGNSGAIYLIGTSSAYTVTYGQASGAAQLTSSNAMTQNAWNFLQWVRSGSTNTLTIAGSSGGTHTDSTSWTATSFIMGGASAGIAQFPGYIGPTRVTKGYARPFSVPTAPFPTC